MRLPVGACHSRVNTRSSPFWLPPGLVSVFASSSSQARLTARSRSLSHSHRMTDRSRTARTLQRRTIALHDGHLQRRMQTPAQAGRLTMFAPSTWPWRGCSWRRRRLWHALDAEGTRGTRRLLTFVEMAFTECDGVRGLRIRNAGKP
jgi:hypothetical protein